MASPCKKFKFTSKKELSPRCTQDSKVTSTPQQCSENTLSPSFSSISSVETGRDNTTHLLYVSDIDFDKENIDPQQFNYCVENSKSSDLEIPQLSSFEIEEDYDSFFHNLGKIKFTGTIWNMYKPQYQDSLYNKVLSEPYNAQGHVIEMLFLLNEKPRKALCKLIQFCVDVCGFQNFDVSKNYNFTENAGIVLINLLKNYTILDKSELLKTNGRYLLMEHSALAKILKIGIYNFIHKLILIGYEKHIFANDMFVKCFFNFIKCMTYSKMRCVRDTGVILAIKMLTPLVLLYNQLVNDTNQAPDNSIEHFKKELRDAIEYFYIIFMRNCQFYDGKSYMMRVECVHELIIWVKHLPEMFLDNFLAIKYINRLLRDPNKDVRHATLEICLKFIDSSKVFDFLKTVKTEFTEAIAGRFFDVDHRVAIKAIDLFTALLIQDDTFVSAEHCKSLFSMIFDKYFPIGQAACRFFNYYFLSISEIPGDTLKNVASLVLMKPGTYVKELVIEGCLDTFKEIRNWELYITLLLEQSGNELENKQALAELFSEAVLQTLMGKSNVVRQLSRKSVVIDKNIHQKLARIFPLLNEILQQFKDFPDVLKEILKIIPRVNSTVLDGKICQECMDMCVTVEVLFNNHNKKNILEELAKVLRYFCDAANFGERAKMIVKRLADKHATDSLAEFAQPTATSPSDVCLRVATLYAQFNLNKYFTWEVLYDNWGEVHSDTTMSLLSCCKWYIIWNLRNITDQSRKINTRQLDNLISIHMRICHEFISSCFNMLDNLDGEPLHYQVFNCICDFYLTHDKDLEYPIKLNKEFERLQLGIDSPEVEQILVKFLRVFVIANDNVSLKDKQAQVIRYVNLIHNGICSIDLLRHVFQYYNIYYTELGPIIEASIMDIFKSDDENIVLMLIVFSMIIIYENILSKHTMVDLNSEDAKNLKLLVQRFLNLKFLRTSNKYAKKLLYFSLVYALRDTVKYDFLYFMKYFIDRLHDDDRRELLNYFKKSIPENADKKDAILYFGNCIKTRIKPTNTKKKPNIRKFKGKKPHISTNIKKMIPPTTATNTLLKTESQVIEGDIVLCEDYFSHP